MELISADLRKRCSNGEDDEMTSYNDRVEGVLLATAAGDALGAPYEFKPPRGPELEVAMVGGAGWEPGEWTDDTSMAIAIAEVAAQGADLLDESAQDAIVQRWLEWSRVAKDIGIQTGSVLAGRGAGRRHHCGQRPRRVGEVPPAHRPHGGQRIADADGAGGARLSRRRVRDGRGGAHDQRAHALRPGRRRRVCVVVQRDPACGADRRAGRSNRHAPHRVRPPRPVGEASG